MQRKRIYVLLGPSGAGKTTIGDFLQKRGIPGILSHTTRPIRDGECEGQQYYFVTKQEWDRLDKIEQSEYSGNYYCLSRDEVENKLRDNDHAYMILDLYGTNCIREAYPEYVRVVYIFVAEDEMRRRMLARGDSPENVERRLQTVRDNDELSYHRYADYIIENVDLNESLKRMAEILEEK